ncbi:uncharacterized protein MONOS_8307 [Monocercomonoides exilis]|uniref:uncharacterized protein n=1 Tax=Monocercomonoides exilis TaxID=2049356 RepID=UPI00355A709C|nr:hypothetical protein MONOS_8307 [Monocercomonoides exilis]|eukprot:MONOS_8307.1-p1 / transcript=MONOS_8307.1 / gene=MONOS_8307 / organism=Monocercomonoides_exilis_PA203 / gene_product=unspecified product / transcript_product=unspecified product / location=Mono_scaffold00310:46490-48550(+) / protein_length=644 / sequence_SO=supercontig / SO=protein_coding / is_pseudo=false
MMKVIVKNNKNFDDETFRINSEFNVIEEIEVLKREIMTKEGEKMKRSLKRLYHLSKIVDPRDYAIDDCFSDENFKQKLENDCGSFLKPIELVAARVLGHISRILCFGGGDEENELPLYADNLSESTKLLVKSIPYFSSEDRYETIENELSALGKCNDEDICTFTTACIRPYSVDCGATPLIGCETPAKIWKWLNGYLSNSNISVIADALQLAKSFYSLEIKLKLGKDVKTNNLLAVDSFLPFPYHFISLKSPFEATNCDSSDWIPPAYHRGPICSVAIKAFRCLGRFAESCESVYIQLFTLHDGIVEKVLSYLDSSWTEDEWKAIFTGSKFFGADCIDIYSSGGANFQKMADGLFCEEESIKQMISKFQTAAVKCVGFWLSKQVYEVITRITKKDLLRQIASLMCNATRDKLRSESMATLLYAYASLSSGANVRPLHRNKSNEQNFNREENKCLPQPLRGKLLAVLAEACEEEGVIDFAYAQIAPVTSEHARSFEAKESEKIRRRLKAKCDPKICPVCALLESSDAEDDGTEPDTEPDSEEDEEEKEEKKDINKHRYKYNNNHIDEGINTKAIEKEKEWKKVLFECLNRGEMSANDFSKFIYSNYEVNVSFVNEAEESEGEEEEEEEREEEENDDNEGEDKDD